MERQEGDKVRVAYISPHMKAHNGARWIEGWVKRHAADIEVNVFNISKDHDGMSERIGRQSHNYEQLVGEIHSIAGHFRGRKFDVIIHPAIGMSGQATQLACLNLAPVQMTAWGHPVTSGMDSLNYYLSSDYMEPVHGQSHYTERLIRLPGSGLSYPRIMDGPGKKTKEDLGLPDKYMFVAQNVMKLNPQWDHLYQAVQEATGLPIVMQAGQVDSEGTIVRERLQHLNIVWLPRLPRPDYLTILVNAEVSLDPPAWNGGNTTIEAIYFGTPVVTLPGEFMRGRHAYCFLKEAGLERFIAKDVADYVRIVSEVVKTRERLPIGSAEMLFENEAPVHALDELFRSCVN